MSYDLASLEAKILSLDVKSMMVLSQLHVSLSDEDIIQWSGAWNYTQKDIVRAMAVICKVFDLEHISSVQEQKKLASELFVTYSQLRFPASCVTPCVNLRSAAMNTQSTPVIPVSEISVDVLSPVAIRISRLSDKRKEYVRCLVSDMEMAAMCATLQLTEASVVQYKSSIFSELQLPKSLGIKNRMNILKQAWDLYARTKKAPIAESTTKPLPEIVPRPVPEQPTPKPVEAARSDVASPHAELSAGGLPAVFFADPASVIGVKLVVADGVIPDDIRTQGYRCEALIAGQQKGSAIATAFLVMVLRK